MALAHHLALLIGEHVLEALGVDDLLALLWGIAAGRALRVETMALPVGRKLLHLTENLPRLLFLLRRQMLPGFHTVQHAQLLLRRQV